MKRYIRTKRTDKNRKYGTFLHNGEISLSDILRMGIPVSRIIRLLKSPKEKSSVEEELQLNCSKCGKRPSTKKDGFCDQCRFDDFLTQMTEKK